MRVALFKHEIEIKFVGFLALFQGARQKAWTCS